MPKPVGTKTNGFPEIMEDDNLSFYLLGIMLYPKRHSISHGTYKSPVFRAVFLQLVYQSVVCGLGEVGLLVQESHNTMRLLK